MKKNKTTKAKIRNLVRLAVILFLAMIVSIIFCRKEIKANDKILENTVHDAFAFQSILLAHHLEPNKPSSYTDIENLEDDSDSFVSDAAIKTGSSQYYIRVNYGANCVNIYTKDKSGNYTKPYKAMICSTGISTPTSGTYKITYKYRWLRLFGDVYGQYSTRIVKNILFHSVPYYEQRADTLEWDEYDKLGTKASAGCIRLTVQDAKWIYDNITSGTYVEFYSDKANPGPLGKPSAQKISDNKKCRDWDPTDPDKNNPWNGGSGIPTITYTQPKKSTKKNTNNKNTSSNKDTSTSTSPTTTTTTQNTSSNEHSNTTSFHNTTNNTTHTTNTTINSNDDNKTTVSPSNNSSDNDTNNSSTTNNSTQKPEEQPEKPNNPIEKPSEKPNNNPIEKPNEKPSEENKTSSNTTTDSQKPKPDDSSTSKPVETTPPTSSTSETTENT